MQRFASLWGRWPSIQRCLPLRVVPAVAASGSVRIALVTHSRRRVGGVESYLEALAAGLTARGHGLAVATEVDEPAHRPPLDLPPGTRELLFPGTEDPEVWPAALREWEPDVVFTHGLLDPAREERVLAKFPALTLLHGYYGACISGHKAWSAPGTPRPCSRPFGAGCLAHYYPHRCGGLDPRAMWRDFRLQSRRRRLLGRYGARLVLSAHLAREYARLDLSTEVLPEPPPGLPVTGDVPSSLPPAPPLAGGLHLLFLGRAEPLKGGAILLDAVANLLGADPTRRVRLDFAGQGSAEPGWRARAGALERRFPGRGHVRFHGWLDAAARGRLFLETHLLVVPSLWPEPLGLVGAEAAAWGVPAVAFAVGGIPGWLRDGENGVLAPADPPTARGLADAIRRATGTSTALETLRMGAWRTAADPGGRAEQHFAAVEAVCARVAGTRPVR